VVHEEAVYWPETHALHVVQEAASDVVEYETPVPQAEHTVLAVLVQAVPMYVPAAQVAQVALTAGVVQ
jgi:hypothetical protein